MAYTPTTWVDGISAATAATLNNIEGGVAAALGTAINAADQGSLAAALTAAAADSRKPPILLSPGTYTLTAAITPFTGMRLIGLGRGSEFGNGVKIVNATTDMFTPTADVSDIHIEGIQFEGDTTNKDTDWWTVGTGFQILYSHIDKCGFDGFRRVYHGNWTGVTFENFYVNTSDTKVQQFKIGGADSIFGPGFIGSSGFNRTTLTATTTSGAGPKVLTVADPTGAVIGNPLYVGNQSNGASGTRDVSIITNISGNDITVGTLANTHNSGEFVHIVMDHAAVESTISHSKIDRLYISPGPGMALHVKGGHSSTFFNCELSGAPAISAGPGLYVIDSTGHQFIGTVLSNVGLKPWGQFVGCATVYDSTDINFAGTIFDNITTSGVNLFRIARSGTGGAALTDRIRMSGTTRYNVTSATSVSLNTAMAQANARIDSDEFYGPMWFPTYKTASYYFCNSPHSTGTSNTLGNGTERLTQWVVTEPLTITRIGAEFTAAGEANSVFRIGIRADDGSGTPSTAAALLDAGSISTGTGNAGTVATGGTPGSYEITLGTAFSLNPGLYWVSGTVQGAATTQPTMRTGTGSSMVVPIPMSAIPAANAANYAYQQTGVTGALGTWSGSSQAASAARIFYKTQ